MDNPETVNLQKTSRNFNASRALPWCFLLFVFGVSFSIAFAHTALGLWLLMWFYCLYKGQVLFKRTPLDTAVLVFLGVDFLAGLTGINPMRSLVHFVSLWHISIYLLVVNTVTERKWLERGLAVLIITVGLNASYGLGQFFNPDFYFFMEEESAQFWGTLSTNREVGTFSHSMTFAGQMMLVSVMGVSLLLWWVKGSKAWKWRAGVSVMLLAWVLTFTRNAWVGGLAGLLSLGLLKGRRVMIGIGSMAVVSVLIFSFFNESFALRIKSIADPAKSSNMERINMWKVTYDMVKENPVLGVGGGNYSVGSEAIRPKYNVKSKSHPHNNLLAQAAEKGLAGLAAYIILWVVFFREGWFAWKFSANNLMRALSAGGLCALIAFHLAGLFEGNFGDSEVAMMMWLMVGFTMWVRVRKGEAEGV